MANRYLLPVYEKLYNETFDYFDFDKRMKMQKAVYLLQDMGVPMGGYSYRWYLHGPYSQELQDDLFELRKSKASRVKIAQKYTSQIGRLCEAMAAPEDVSYDGTKWVECLGSLHYIKKRVLRFDASREDVLSKLVEKKPHLDDPASNAAAYRVLEELFA